MVLNGFQMLQSEHVLGQDPGDSIYFGPLIFYPELQGVPKVKKKKKLASVLLVTTSRYITQAEPT